MKKGDLVKGHFCISCLKYVDHTIASENNPYKTDWCIRCSHRQEGLNSTGQVGRWLIIGRSEVYDVESAEIADSMQTTMPGDRVKNG